MPTSLSKKKFLAYILVWILAVSIGMYFRLYPLRTFTKHDSAGKATLVVFSRLKAQVETQIKTMYPNADETQKKILTQKLFKELLQKENAKLAETIQKVTASIDELSPPRKDTPYLLESDSFHFFQLTEQLIETGRISDSVQGSKYLNRLMLAPKGHLEPVTLHPFIGSVVYECMKVFNRDVDLMYAVSFTPLVLCGISLIFFIWICHQLGSSLLLTFVGSVFFMCAPIMVKRSAFGWYDNDPYNILFPLAMLGLIFYALKWLDSKKLSVLFIGLISALMLGYALFWQGWMLVFVVFMSGGLAAALAVKYIHRDEPNFKRLLFFFSGIFILSFVLISLKFGVSGYVAVFQEGFKALDNFITPQLSPWPDLYISVGELHKATLTQIIILTGGFVQFLFILTGLICFCWDALRKKDLLTIVSAATLGLFALITLYLSLGAQRFALLCLPPFGILFVIGLNRVSDWVGGRLKKHSPFKNQTWTGYMPQVILVGLIAIPLYTLQKSMPFLLSKIYNDTWHAALTTIRDETPENSIINAWWPPGHFIKATAHRRVTFDGATINYPQAYWLTRVYLSQSEREAIGLLRMLNNSANDAAEYLQSLGLNVSDAVTVLRSITYLNESQARLLLSTKMKQKDRIDHLLNLTHAKPDPSYLFIYNELVEKNIQLAFIGKWNFEKIAEINRSPLLLKKVPNRKSKEYVQFLWNIAGGPYKYNDPLTEMNRRDEWILFDGNVKVNMSTHACVIDSPKFGKGVPQSIFYVENGNVVEHVFEPPVLSYSVILYNEGAKYSVVLLDRYLANSLIMRLYYFGDTGMKYIKTFTEEKDLGKKTDIRVFSIDWDQFLNDQNMPVLTQ